MICQALLQVLGVYTIYKTEKKTILPSGISFIVGDKDYPLENVCACTHTQSVFRWYKRVYSENGSLSYHLPLTSQFLSPGVPLSSFVATIPSLLCNLIGKIFA